MNARLTRILTLGLLALLVITVRLRLLDMPLERDEGEYAYAGQLILQGVAPYGEVFNMKLPGTYAAYAVIMAVFGQTPSGIHFGLLLVNLASIALIYLIGRLLLDEPGALAAAVAFGFLSLSPYILGLQAHATHFVVFFALGGIYLLLLATGGGERGAGSTEHGAASRERSEQQAASQPSTLNSQLSTLNRPVRNTALPKHRNTETPEHRPPGPKSLVFSLWSLVRREVSSPSSLVRDSQSRKSLVRRVVLSLWSLVSSPWSLFFASGCLFGLAFLMKQHGVFFGLFGALWLGWRLWGAPQARSVEQGAGSRERGAGSREHGARSHGNTETPKHRNTGTFLQETTEATEERPGTSRGGAETRSCGVPASAGPKSLVFSLWSLVRREVFSPSPLVHLWLFASGLALPYLITCGILFAAGVFPQFWFWTMTYASQYATAVPFTEGDVMLKRGLRVVSSQNLPFWLLPWIGLFLMWWDKRLSTGIRGFLVTLLLLSFGSVAVGFYFREHYFITLLPVLALLTGAGLSWCLHLVRTDRSIALFMALPVLLLGLIAVGAALIGNGQIWFGLPPDRAMREVYGSTLFAETRKVGLELRSSTAPDAKLAVLGSEPQIYFYARRRAATGYIYMYPLMEKHEFAGKMRQEFKAAIETNQPSAVVMVTDQLSWLWSPEGYADIDKWWQDYWPSRLQPGTTYQVENGWEEVTPVPGFRRTTEGAQQLEPSQIMVFAK